MPWLSGFQANTTISAAFWIYKPDPTVDQQSKQQFVEVNAIQRIEATPELILANVTSVTVANNILTVSVSDTSLFRRSPGVPQAVIFAGLGNATFLNGQIAFINTVNTQAGTITANFTATNYGPTAETQGQVIDASARKVWLYYPQQAVAPSQAPQTLEGPAAALFVYDMEVLFT